VAAARIDVGRVGSTIRLARRERRRADMRRARILGAIVISALAATATPVGVAFGAGPPASVLRYDGPTSAVYRDPILASATLASLSGFALAGRPVDFSLVNTSATCSGTTGPDGRASCALPAPAITGSYTLRAAFAGDIKAGPASTSVPFVVTRRASYITYKGPSTFPRGSTANIGAVLTDGGTLPLGGRIVTLTIGSGASSQRCTARTKSTGLASCAIAPVGQAPGLSTVQVDFAGDRNWMSSTTGPMPITITGSPITLSADSLDFGTAFNTQPADLSVTVTNLTASDQTVHTDVTNDQTWLYPPFSAGPGTCHLSGADVVVPAAGSCVLTVTFARFQAGYQPLLGSFTGMLAVTDRASGTVQAIRLSGTSDPALVIASPIDFGAVPAYDSASRLVTVTNESDREVGTWIDTGSTAGPFRHEPGGSCVTTDLELDIVVEPHSSCSIRVTFYDPDTGWSFSALLTTFYTAGASMTATVVNFASVDTTPIDFGKVAAGDTARIPVKVTNISKVPLQLLGTSVSGSGAFALGPGGTCPLDPLFGWAGFYRLPAGASCTLDLGFAPTSLGPATASLSLTGPGEQLIPLSGTAIAPLSLSPASLDFGQVATGSSATRLVTVTSRAQSPVPVQPRFQQLESGWLLGPPSPSSCPPLVPPGATCTIAVTYAPQVPGGETNALVVPAAGGTLAVPLAATAVLPVTLSTSSLALGPLPAGDTATQALVLTNHTSVFQPIGLSFRAPPGFSGAVGCALGRVAGVRANSSCTVRVSFTAPVSGSYGGFLDVTAAGAVQTVSLAATVMPALAFEPTGIAFGAVAVGETRVATITVTNHSGALQPLGATFSGAGFGPAGGTTCVLGPLGGVAPGATCTIAVLFAPLLPGSYGGAVDLASAEGITSISLSGEGAAALGVDTTSIDFGSVSVLKQGSVSRTVTIKNSSGVDQPFTLGLVPPPSALAFSFAIDHGTCVAAIGDHVAANSTCAFSIRFNPSLAPRGLRLSSQVDLTYLGGLLTIDVTGTSTP
jgi:hypothetical protein